MNDLAGAAIATARGLRGQQVVPVKGNEEKLERSRTFNHPFKQM